MPPTADAAERHVVHAYGVVAAGALDDAGSLLPPEGIGGSPVRLLPLSRLGVVVGDLDARRFGEAAWRAHAEDPAWLEPVARGHHEVLRAVASSVDVLPLRLPGIYGDDESLASLLGSEQESLLERLHFVTGHEEWGVHVHLMTGATGGSSAAEATPAAASGRDYLLRRKQAVADRDTARERRQQLLDEVCAALAGAATSSVLNQPQDRALSGRDEPMLLNSAHLVPRRSREEFFASADEVSRRLLEPEDLVMEISGPWPPYNFAAPGAAGEGEGAR